MAKRTIWTGLALVLLVTPLIWGATQARVAGKVTDSSGTPIPNATITITSGDVSTFTKELVTDKKGRFKVLILDATKNYTFRFEAPGYVAREEPVKVGVGSMDNEVNAVLPTIEEAQQGEQDQLRVAPGYKELEDGFELIKQGQKSAAREKFQEAVAALPDLVQGWSVLAELDYEIGDYQAAYDNAVRCLELDDESSSCLAVAANSAAKLGKTEEQQEYMARFQALNPDDPATIFNEAVPYLNAMDDENARPILERCLEIDPDFPKCLYEYGMMLLRSGDMEGAKERLERYLEVAPDGVDASAAAETIKYL